MRTGKPKIACMPNGPYYLLSDLTPQLIPHLQKSNGEPCLTIRGVALCRCGASKYKPFCDGSHWDIGFQDEKN